MISEVSSAAAVAIAMVGLAHGASAFVVPSGVFGPTSADLGIGTATAGIKRSLDRSSASSPSRIKMDTGVEDADVVMNRFSSILTQRKSQGASQAMLFATGLKLHDMNKAQIGISSVWFEGNPCNMHLLDLAEQAKIAVVDQDMVGFRFNTIGVSDGISMGTKGEPLLGCLLAYSRPDRLCLRLYRLEEGIFPFILEDTETASVCFRGHRVPATRPLL